MEEIKAPCPFCGTSPEDHDEGSPILYVDFQDDAWFVKCSNCGAKGPRAAIEEEAIERWNRRVTETEITQAKKGADTKSLRRAITF